MNGLNVDTPKADMLIQVGDNFFDHADVSSVLAIESKTKPVAGAAFEFKPETEITLKTGKTIRTTARSTHELAAEIKKADEPVEVNRLVGDSDYNYPAAVEDLIKELKKTNEHLHTLAELTARYVMRSELQ